MASSPLADFFKLLLEHSVDEDLLDPPSDNNDDVEKKRHCSIEIQVICDNARMIARSPRHNRRVFRRSSSSDSFFSAQLDEEDEKEEGMFHNELLCKVSDEAFGHRRQSKERWGSSTSSSPSIAERRRSSLLRSSSAPTLPARPTRRRSIDPPDLGEVVTSNDRFPDMNIALSYLQQKYAVPSSTSTTTTPGTEVVDQFTPLNPKITTSSAPCIPRRRESLDSFGLSSALLLLNTSNHSNSNGGGASSASCSRRSSSNTTSSISSCESEESSSSFSMLGTTSPAHKNAVGTAA